MTELHRSLEKIHWLFDRKSHINQVIGISMRDNDVLVELSDQTKNFVIRNINQYDISDLLEQICREIDKADKCS